VYRAKHQGEEALRDELVCWKERLRGCPKLRAAEALLGSVTHRRGMGLYPSFLARGRQIGSGPIDSRGKATTYRIKGVGMRWVSHSAEAIRALEASEQSGAWQVYWDSCLQQTV
jgi:hypothetical protein